MTYQVVREFVDASGVARKPGESFHADESYGALLSRRGYLVPLLPVSAPRYGIRGGNPGRLTSREENVAALASALALAAGVRTKFNAHCADVLDHTTAPDIDNPVTGDDPATLAQLLAFTGALLAAYDAHDADAEKVANWVYHDAQEAGDHSLASVVAPTDLQECVTRLNDMKTKFNAHDADATAHGVGSAHQVATAAAAYGAIVRIPEPGAQAGDLIGWSLLDSGTGVVKGVTATAGAGHVDFEFSADPQNDAVISYMLLRQEG
jgi:hypothetical protein